MFDPDHFARVMQFERDATQYVKKRFRTLYQNCIGRDMVGDFIHNPYWGTSFPPVISPLLRTHRLRDWSVVKTLQQVEKGPE